MNTSRCSFQLFLWFYFQTPHFGSWVIKVILLILFLQLQSWKLFHELNYILSVPAALLSQLTQKPATILILIFLFKIGSFNEHRIFLAHQLQKQKLLLSLVDLVNNFLKGGTNFGTAGSGNSCGCWAVRSRPLRCFLENIKFLINHSVILVNFLGSILVKNLRTLFW